MLEEIPSGGESELSEDENESDDDTVHPSNGNFRAETIIPHVNDESEPDISNEIDDQVEWDTDDDLPLATLLGRSRNIVVRNGPNVQWSREVLNNYNNNVIPFDQQFGPDMPPNIEEPLDIFTCLFSEELFEKITFETNLYAVQRNQGNANCFIPTTSEEIKCFIGINLMMGIKKLPSYKDYWSSRQDLRDHFIASAMSRNRFSWLLGHIHLNDNSLQPKKGQPEFDKLYKVRPMLNKLSESFTKYYKPSRCQSIDESMIRFKGRCSMKQFMPLKPIKRGYKIWVRANESAFVSEFQIYTGNLYNYTLCCCIKYKKNVSGKVDVVTEQNLGGRVVTDLTRDLIGKHHAIYMDNYFSSLELFQNLKTDSIYACGTVRKTRKHIPKDFKPDKDMSRGDSDWRISTDEMVCVKWMDNKPVHFLSNFHDPGDTQLISRKQKDGSTKDISCLQLVKDYNKHMGYVDKSDMLKSCYEIDRKSKKWWHRILWHFIDLTLVNAFIIFNERSCGVKHLSLKYFRLAVANGLIGAEPSTPRRAAKTSTPEHNKFKVYVPMERRTDKVAHIPIHGSKVRCARCSTRSKPHRTRWHCTSCKVGLCLTNISNCFAEFHKK